MDGIKEFILPPGSSKEAFDTPFPAHICWEVGLSPGSYLAELDVESAEDGLLRYRWAFKVVNYENFEWPQDE